MLTRLLIRLGFSRDDLLWIWLQTVSVAGLISTNVFDMPYWLGYLGLTVSPLVLHWIMAAAALVLWISGHYHTSPLPSATAMQSGTVPGSPAASIVVDVPAAPDADLFPR